jgi:hypothetical protein
VSIFEIITKKADDYYVEWILEQCCGDSAVLKSVKVIINFFSILGLPFSTSFKFLGACRRLGYHCKHQNKLQAL